MTEFVMMTSNEINLTCLGSKADLRFAQKLLLKRGSDLCVRVSGQLIVAQLLGVNLRQVEPLRSSHINS